MQAHKASTSYRQRISGDQASHERIQGTVEWLRESEFEGYLGAEAIARKPKGHDFIIDRRHTAPAVRRHMSVTGG